MSSNSKLKLNSISALLTKIVVLVSGLILPRMILNQYGSEANGLVVSITQFLSVITFLDLGVGSVVQSALYKPLVNDNHEKISKILKDALQYFRKIAYIIVVYVILLGILYPLMVDTDSLGYLGTITLIISISISTFAQYYFGIVNELLLNADQKAYIQLSAEIVVIILNLIVSYFLISLNFSIQVVKLSASLIFLLRPLFLSYYVNKNYTIIYTIDIDEDVLPQKWNGMAQHIAFSIQNSTDIVILTIFSTLENISIYSVYNMVVSGIKMLVTSLTTGLQAFLGQLYASENEKDLSLQFSKIEWIIHNSVVFLYTITIILIGPFVKLYTSDVKDINYEAPIFSVLIVLSAAIYSLRIPYQSMVFAAGHYKQTQVSSIIEAILNMVVSFILVHKFEMNGVMFGTIIAVFYRLCYLVYYLSKLILKFPIYRFVKLLFIDLLSSLLILSTYFLFLRDFLIHDIKDWITIAIFTSVISILIILVVNYVLNRKELLMFIKSFGK